MQDTLEALLKLVALDDLPRTGWIQHGISDPESVAGHVLGVAHLALALAPRVDPPLDVDRVVALAVVHDASEALTGDLPKPASRLLPPGAKAQAEAAASRELFEPCHPVALARCEEYEAGETREARFAKLCDRLQLGVRLLAYKRAGFAGLEDFVETLTALDCGEFAAAEQFRRALLESI